MQPSVDPEKVKGYPNGCEEYQQYEEDRVLVKVKHRDDAIGHRPKH
jgi:hypothetical protein